jgi:hypothetical protein
MLRNMAIVLVLALVESRGAAAPPVITWVSDPVGPNETVVAMGDGFGQACTAEIGRLPDRPPAEPSKSGPPEIPQWTTIQPLQSDNQCVKFVIPPDFQPGVYAFRVRSGDGVSNAKYINAPDPWWLQGDQGETASPGGWMRIFGRCLAPKANRQVQVALVAADGKPLCLKAGAADDYAVRLSLPQDLAAGAYTVWVHNGLGGNGTWREAGRLTVQAPRNWKTDVFNVKDFGPNEGTALLAALKKAEANGGGVVYLPRGRYPVAGRLVIPPNTVLRGEAMGLVTLYWPDFDTAPRQLITGGNFGIESLSIYCQNHYDIIQDSPTSDGVFLRRVRIRANCFFMIEHIGTAFRGRHGPVGNQKCGAAIMLQGRNFEITDCDIYASNSAIQIHHAKVGLIARNRLCYGGRGYRFEGTDRLILEDNLISGNNLVAIGNDITTFWSSYSRHIYYAHNRLQFMFGADREMMTYDAGGQAYFGKVAAVDGVHLTLAGDPDYRDFSPKPRSDWTGAAVLILDGRGAGQYRFVAKNDKRQWEVDRPWDVPPDETSRISIVPFRGQNLFIGNTFEDGGAFQLYGMAIDVIVAENKGARMDGFLTWGHMNPQGWGVQPSWFCQFLDNEIVEGNGYGNRTASFGTVMDTKSAAYAGPLGRCILFRRNRCRNNASFGLGESLRDALVEHCTIAHADLGITVGAKARGVLLRENALEDVARPYQGEGLHRAIVVPTR